MIQERLATLVKKVESFATKPAKANLEGIPSVDYARIHSELSVEELQRAVSEQRSRFLHAIHHLFSDPTELNKLVLEVLDKLENPKSLAIGIPEIVSIKAFDNIMPMLDEKYDFDLSDESAHARKHLRQSKTTKSIFSVEEIVHALDMVDADPSILEVPNMYFTLIGIVLEGVKSKYEEKYPGSQNPLFGDIQWESWGDQSTISRYIVPALCVCSKVMNKDCFDPDVCKSASDLLNRSGAFEKGMSDRGRSFKVYCPAQQFINKILCDTTVFRDMQKILREKRKQKQKITESSTSNSGTTHS